MNEFSCWRTKWLVKKHWNMIVTRAQYKRKQEPSLLFSRVQKEAVGLDSWIAYNFRTLSLVRNRIARIWLEYWKMCLGKVVVILPPFWMWREKQNQSFVFQLLVSFDNNLSVGQKVNNFVYKRMCRFWTLDRYKFHYNKYHVIITKFLAEKKKISPNFP